MVFPFKEKGFSYKFLCSCVVVLLLCLLKFIHSYIEFFLTPLLHFQVAWKITRNSKKIVNVQFHRKFLP